MLPLVNANKNQCVKVQYFFVGVGKCGTSWIYEITRKFDLLTVPSIKEPYLIDQSPAQRDEAVESLFSNSEAMADFSNVYYWDPENAEKIRDYNPAAKIIITVRKPSRRVISHFRYLKRSGVFQNQTLRQYLENGDSNELIKRSRYREIIERYQQHFPDNQVLVMPLELLKKSPQDYLNRLMNFCGRPTHALSEADKQPVLKQSEARHAFLSRVAKSLAVSIRKLGYLKLLSQLKDSKVISRLLYREMSGQPKNDVDFGSLTKEIQELDDDYESLLETLDLNL